MSSNLVRAIMIINTWSKEARLKAAAARKGKAGPKRELFQKSRSLTTIGQTESSVKHKISAKNSTQVAKLRKDHHDKMSKKGFRLSESHPTDGDTYTKKVGDHRVMVRVVPHAEYDRKGKGTNTTQKGVRVESSVVKHAYSKHGYKHDPNRPSAQLRLK